MAPRDGGIGGGGGGCAGGCAGGEGVVGGGEEGGERNLGELERPTREMRGGAPVT